MRIYPFIKCLCEEDLSGIVVNARAHTRTLASFQPTNQPLFHPSSFSPTFTSSSTSLFNSCYLTRNRQSTLSIIWFILWSRYCSYHRTKEISNYPLNSKSFHNHRYLPLHLKITYNQPTVKKTSLNKQDLSNYRPIANLFFISKLTEIFKKRLLDHLTFNSLLNPVQSSYIKFYSTETTLVSLHDHLSNAMSMQQVSCLCLLDLSAAFDTLDYSILLHRLSTWFGISSVSLQWFTSYLSSPTSTYRDLERRTGAAYIPTITFVKAAREMVSHNRKHKVSH